MSKIRVGFVLRQVGWLGGVNYFRNLFMALNADKDSSITPVIFTGFKSDVSAFEGLVEIVRTSYLDHRTLPWFLSRIVNKIFFGRDYLLFLLLVKKRITLISHYHVLWKGCSIRSMGWIPDFQHVHLPNFFSKEECLNRDKHFLELIKKSNAIIVSSQDSKKDLNQFFPDNTTPIHVLNFVPNISSDEYKCRGHSELMTYYNIDRPWFYIPNQFWAHKNHAVVIEALCLLKKEGLNFLVIASGSTQDSRNPNYYNELMKTVNSYGLQNDFRAIGVIPYPDVIALMKHSIAVINPSLFEGWSTSVEEAKAMGKKIILSDIEVHKEQNPERGYYFNSQDPQSLANQMKKCVNEFHENEEIECYAKAQAKQNLKMIAFAKNYEKICLHTIQK